jgi:hypothetical protein
MMPLDASLVNFGVGEQASLPSTSENASQANFAEFSKKPSEKSHERANLLAIRRLIAA